MDRACLRLDRVTKECARVIVALTDSGRAYLDQKARTLELAILPIASQMLPEQFGPTPLARLQAAYGPDIVALSGPDGTPRAW